MKQYHLVGRSLLKFIWSTIFWLNCVMIACESLGVKDVIFVVLSQNNPYHESKALQLKQDLLSQTKNVSFVYLTHQDFQHPGDWTVVPLLPDLWNIHQEKYNWIFFCTHDTKINVAKLLRILDKASPNELFIGRGSTDQEPTIIHHFSSLRDFKYPLFASGFALHRELVQGLVEVIETKEVLKNIDFSIDASHELALFIKNYGGGVTLTDSYSFCVQNGDECATFVSYEDSCGKPVDEIFFAVKTYSKFHNDRVPIVKATWKNKTQFLAFYSDQLDEKIPTVRLNVPNTIYGHCSKTHAIIKDLKNRMKNLKWAVISDDDTLFSVHRLQKVLSCYDDKVPFIIGERYGYDVTSEGGYNYITGGGGVVLSKAALARFWNFEEHCTCPTNETPDDMYLFGVCLQRLNITLVHVPAFHQARPNDYNADYLSIGKPVSFHKHWMIDPIQVYKDWCEEDEPTKNSNAHNEL